MCEICNKVHGGNGWNDVNWYVVVLCKSKKELYMSYLPDYERDMQTLAREKKDFKDYVVLEFFRSEDMAEDFLILQGLNLTRHRSVSSYHGIISL